MEVKKIDDDEIEFTCQIFDIDSQSIFLSYTNDSLLRGIVHKFLKIFEDCHLSYKNGNLICDEDMSRYILSLMGKQIIPKYNPMRPDVEPDLCGSWIAAYIPDADDVECMLAGEGYEFEINAFEPVMVYEWRDDSEIRNLASDFYETDNIKNIVENIKKYIYQKEANVPHFFEIAFCIVWGITPFSNLKIYLKQLKTKITLIIDENKQEKYGFWIDTPLDFLKLAITDT